MENISQNGISDTTAKTARSMNVIVLFKTFINQSSFPFISLSPISDTMAIIMNKTQDIADAYPILGLDPKA